MNVTIDHSDLLWKTLLLLQKPMVLKSQLESFWSSNDYTSSTSISVECFLTAVLSTFLLQLFSITLRLSHMLQYEYNMLKQNKIYPFCNTCDVFHSLACRFFNPFNRLKHAVFHHCGSSCHKLCVHHPYTGLKSVLVILKSVVKI